MTMRPIAPVAPLALFAALACSTHPESAGDASSRATPVAGTEYVVPDTTIDDYLEAPGVAHPVLQSTLSTRLMGTVTDVLVREGDVVAAGATLLRIDAGDLAAKAAQAGAAMAGAEAVQRDARVQATRLRALFADSAATRAQLDAAETGLARADAAVRAARATADEVRALTRYATLTAPFGGVITRRFVDPGAFAAPGAPLLTVQRSDRLRLSANVAPGSARAVRRGTRIGATIEGRDTVAVVEGVVPATAGNVYTVNALVQNPGGDLLAGSAATLQLPQGRRRAVLVPAAAIHREGDLTGVTVRDDAGDEVRWIRLGAGRDGFVEVLAGLDVGERVIVPTASGPDVATNTRGGR